jgi:hypothetical protein
MANAMCQTGNLRPDLDRWENEGGALGVPNGMLPIPKASRSATPPNGSTASIPALTKRLLFRCK